MSEEDRRPPPPNPENQDVEGGDRDVSTDQQPPSSGAIPEPAPEERRQGDETRDGGMGGEAF